MNIERDKWYVLRNGEKVRVICVDAPGEWPVVALNSRGFALYYKATGKHLAEPRQDIIREHRQSTRVWVNMYPTGEVNAYETEARAKRNGSTQHSRIAVEFVEVEK